MIQEPSIKIPGTYSMTLDKDAQQYLRGFTERATLKGTWARSPEVKSCYAW